MVFLQFFNYLQGVHCMIPCIKKQERILCRNPLLAT